MRNIHFIPKNIIFVVLLILIFSFRQVPTEAQEDDHTNFQSHTNVVVPINQVQENFADTNSISSHSEVTDPPVAVPPEDKKPRNAMENGGENSQQDEIARQEDSIERIHQLGSVEGANYGYIEYLPRHYDQTNQWPLIIFLHGLGELAKLDENGKSLNIERVVSYGPINYASPKRKKHDLPAVIVAPQTIKSWKPSEIEKFRAFAVSKYKVDVNRVYLTGLSLGGGGVYNYLNKYSNNLAAAVPICGTGYLNSTGAVEVVKNHVAIWAAHAQDDKTVKVGNTFKDFGSLSAALGGQNKVDKTDFIVDGVKTKTAYFDSKENKFVWKDGQIPQTEAPDYFFTLYSTGGHGIWTRMYNDPKVYEWLLKHHKE